MSASTVASSGVPRPGRGGRSRISTRICVAWLGRWRAVGTQNSPFLAERCNFIAMSGYCHDMSSVCLPYVVCNASACIMTKRLKLGTCSFYQNIAQCHNSLDAKFNDKIRRRPLDIRLKVGWVVFDFVMLYLGNGVG